jgi:hypothetical protein
MNEESQPSAPGSPPVDSATAAVCPISADFLPPNMRKHVDPKAPAPLRMMAAKALVPLSPSDMVSALYMLTFDAESAVRQTAASTLTSLPGRILSAALRDEEIKPQVLRYCLEAFAGRDDYVELLVLNAGTPDDAVAKVASSCQLRIAEIIGQNQLRILRYDDILRNLCKNPNAIASLIDVVCDFAVRNGMVLQDVPQMQQSRVRVFGPEALQKPPEQGPTALEVIAENAELRDENAPPVEEGTRLTLSQRVSRMSVSEKIKLATIGNKEARGLLMRDANRLVGVAVIRSPRITEGEVLTIAHNRAVLEDVLRVIYLNREWTKSYALKLALVKNPKTPLAISMRYLSGMREADVIGLARNKNIPSGIQLQARKMIEKKSAPNRER